MLKGILYQSMAVTHLNWSLEVSVVSTRNGSNWSWGNTDFKEKELSRRDRCCFRHVGNHMRRLYGSLYHMPGILPRSHLPGSERRSVEDQFGRFLTKERRRI